MRSGSTAGHASAINRILATPYARRLARDAGVALDGIAGSGPRGRIQGTDVLAARQRGTSATRTHVPSVAGLQPAPLHPAAIGTQRALSLAHVIVDRGPLGEVMVSLAHLMQTVRPLDFVTLAAARAMPLLVGGSSAALGIELATANSSARAALAIAADARLSAVSAAIADAYRRAADGTYVAASGGALLIVPADTDLALFAPAAPGGWTAALGVATSEGAGGRHAGSLTLALSWDSAAVPNAAAVAFLTTLKRLLEEPLAMLAA